MDINFILFCFLGQCDPLVSPLNGNLTLSGINNNTTTLVTYDCLTGSTISGDVTSECLPDGSWSSQTPSCGKYNINYIYNKRRGYYWILKMRKK